MNFTLEQARSLVALAEHGTLTKAAASMKKRHSAIVYSLKQLELQTDLELFDRTGYRIRLTSAGERVLAECHKVLGAVGELERACRTIKTGWEPRVRIVFDGIFPVSGVVRAVRALTKVPTHIEVHAEFLEGALRAFHERAADLMISVLPPRETLEHAKLAPLVAHLVVRRDHALAKKRRVTEDDLLEHPLLTVRGSDPRLALSTARVEGGASMHLNDFHTKREAILAGIGYGWLPDYLDSPKLARVRFAGGSRHVFAPHVYWRADRALGRAAKLVVDALL